MKKPLVSLLLIIASVPNTYSALIMTAIYDGSDSTPKGVELYVTTTGSYDGWTLQTQFNANTTFSSAYTFDSTIYNEGDFIYVTSTVTDTTLASQVGIIISDGDLNMNGDDRVRLTDGTNVIDQYGVTNTDGTGTTWEYTDSYAIRNVATDSDGDFTEADWTILPINTLDSGNAPLSLALGTFAVPEPTTALLGSLALLSLLRRRR